MTVKLHALGRRVYNCKPTCLVDASTEERSPLPLVFAYTDDHSVQTLASGTPIGGSVLYTIGRVAMTPHPGVLYPNASLRAFIQRQMGSDHCENPVNCESPASCNRQAQREDVGTWISVFGDNKRFSKSILFIVMCCTAVRLLIKLTATH